MLLKIALALSIAIILLLGYVNTAMSQEVSIGPSIKLD